MSETDGLRAENRKEEPCLGSVCLSPLFSLDFLIGLSSLSSDLHEDEEREEAQAGEEELMGILQTVAKKFGHTGSGQVCQ